MYKNQVKTNTKIMVLISFLIMIITNAMANLLPLNNKATNVISDMHPNLFAPAGITFTIWGVIYFLLLMFVLYFFGFFNYERSKMSAQVFSRIGYLFIVTSLVNAAWLFAWHWEMLFISVLIMIIMLISLIMTVLILKEEDLNNRERVFIKLPFSVYFGWITIATIANITTYLVSVNWDGFGLPIVAWTIIMLVIGMLIGLIITIFNQDMAYGLVMIWAYAGILIKHVSSSGHSSQYPAVMITVIVSLIAFILAEAYLLLKKENR